MNISRGDLDRAARQGILSEQQAAALWTMLQDGDGTRPRFSLAHVAYYTGALIVIGALGWFMTLAWEQFGGGVLALIATIYAACFATAGAMLWKRSEYKVPGGLLVTVAVCMTPLIIYGIERVTGIWPQGDPGNYRSYYEWVKGSWILMELGTALAGLVALRFVRFPFLVAPIAFSLWYMSMDLTPLLFGQNEFGWDQRLWVSLIVGLIMLIVAFVIDHRTREDYAFWLYLFGMLAFWGGLSLMQDGELGWLAYGIINAGLIIMSVFLLRRVFTIFGGLGLVGYFGHLAYVVFENSLLFPFALSALGIMVIAVGVLYQRHYATIERAVLGILPGSIQRLRPVERG